MAPLIPVLLLVLLATACGGPAPQQTASSPTVTARPTTPPSQTPAPAEDREPAPDFTLTTLDGGTFTLSEERGRPVVLNFWAPW